MFVVCLCACVYCSYVGYVLCVGVGALVVCEVLVLVCVHKIYTFLLLHPLPRCVVRLLYALGHLTHGYYTYSKADGHRKPVSATSIYFESLPYSVHPVS